MQTPETIRAHRILLEVALTITNSPLRNPRDLGNAQTNAQIALLTNALAGRHIADLDGSPETVRMQARLIASSNPYMQAMEDQFWHETLDTNENPECCCSLQSSGRIYHHCQVDEKPMPCINCPMLTASMPGITGGIPRQRDLPPPATNEPDLPRAEADAMRIMHLLAQWADTIAPQTPGVPNAIAAAIACADTAFYTAAAIEWHEGEADPINRRSNEIHERMYHLIGGPPEPTFTMDPNSGTRTCVYEFSTEEEAQYDCMESKLTHGDHQGRPAPCRKCPFQNGAPKPMPWQILQAAVQEKPSPARRHSGR